MLELLTSRIVFAQAHVRVRGPMKDVAEAQVLVSWCRERKEMPYMDGHSNDTVCDAMCVSPCASAGGAKEEKWRGRRKERAEIDDQYVRLTTEYTND